MKTLRTLSLLLCLSIYQSVVTEIQEIQVQLDDKFNLTWLVLDEDVGAVENGIYFEITAKTNGWVGLGFTKDHGMTNADIVVAGQDDAGMGYVSDYFSTGESTPQLDEQQNYELYYIDWNANVTTLRVHRPLDTGDPKDHKIQNETIELIWALHTSDMTTTSFPQHTSRGHVRLNLLDYKGVENDSDHNTWSSEMENGESGSEHEHVHSSETSEAESSESSEPEPEPEG